MRGLELGDESSAIITPFHPDWVMPLQREGNLRPVFVFPSSHSDPAMRSDAEIACLVGSDRPFWGLAHTERHRSLVRQAGVVALAAEYVTQIQALQRNGPYLLFGNCLGGYLAWETARQLLAQGEAIGGVLFFESPLRTDFRNVRTGPIPVDTTSVWRLGHYYAPQALPVRLTHLMTPEWHGAKWWQPWKGLALDGMEAVVLHTSEAKQGGRAVRMSTAIRAWCAAAEATLPT